MTLADFGPVLLQLILALAIPAVILIASHLFGQRASGNYIKDAAYECGLPPEGDPQPRFSVKFYVVAMLFILFDIEVVFLFPWVMVYRELLALGIPALTPMLFFIALLTLGLAYEFKKKGIEWERISRPGEPSTAKRAA
ncbi:MAG: NADH-quinone oxidoreductase subunit A [Opitutales bacterium]